MRRYLLVFALVLAGCAAPPAFTGNNSGIHMQGGTPSQAMYVNTGWQGDASCNQYITDQNGRWIGWYVDDSVNYNGNPNQEQLCVTADRQQYPSAIIIAALTPGEPHRRYAGATFNAFEAYPLCGSGHTGFWPPPPESAYIMQYNFVRPGCPATPLSAVQKLSRALVNSHPALLLYY